MQKLTMPRCYPCDVPFEFADSYPTYVNIELPRAHAMGYLPNDESKYTPRPRGWMSLNEPVSEHAISLLTKGLPRIESPQRRSWLAKWINMELFQQNNELAVRRVTFIQRNMLSTVFRPFMTTDEASVCVHSKPQEVILRLSSTFPGVLSLTYALCEECPVCLTCENQVVQLPCKHMIGLDCWLKIENNLCPHCRHQADEVKQYSRVGHSNVELNVRQELIIHHADPVSVLLGGFKFDSPEDLQAAIIRINANTSHPHELQRVETAHYGFIGDQSSM